LKKLFLYIVSLFFFTPAVFAQTYSACFNIKPGFFTAGCDNLYVEMEDCSGSPFIEYDFGDGLGFGSASTHTYTSPGYYTVRQRVETGGSSVDIQTRVNYIRVIERKPAKFDVEICEGRVVRLVFNDTEHDNYSVVMGDGTIYPSVVPPTVLTHTYPDTSPRNITVQGNYANTNGCSGPAVGVSVTPLQAVLKPDISSVTVNNQSASANVTLSFNAVNTQKYLIQQSINGTGSWTTIDTVKFLSGQINRTYSNLNTSANRYCYRLIAYDDCGRTETSEEICSLINTATASNNQNDLSWTGHLPGNVNSYLIYRNGSQIAALPSGTLNYTDLDVNCGVNYCYQIYARLNQTDVNGNNLLSVSAEQCVTGISNTIPTAVENLNSTIQGNSVLVSWDTPVAFSAAQYHISRSVNGVTLSLYMNSSNNPITDNKVNIPGNTYCYSIDYTDNCGNKSVAGSTTCPVILNVSIDNNNNYLNHLSWTSYTGQWIGGVQEYQIEILNESNTVVNVINAGLSFSYSDFVPDNGAQVIRYRIKAVSSGGTQTSYSNIVEIKYEGVVYLPNAFSPDGDGNNDIFFAKGQFIKEYKLTIFNRWGEIVYFTEVFTEGWDGNYLGTAATADTYAYLVEISDLWGKTITKRGTVTLLR
jgi:gliding motility-associated-like protein